MFTHLYWYVEHETWFPCVSHTHHSDPIGIAYAHFLQTQTNSLFVTCVSIIVFSSILESSLCFTPYRTWRGNGRASWTHMTAQPEHPLHEVQSDSKLISEGQSY